MAGSRFSHLRAILQALLVTFLWSTSWVLIKFGLRDIPPVTFAGLRYALAFAFLLPLALRSSNRQLLRRLSGRRWIELTALGLLFYALTQGASFVSLAYLPAMTTSLLWNLTTITVAMLGICLLAEPLTPFQWTGVVLNLLGVLIYFHPPALAGGQLVGLAAALVGVLANAGSSILGRSVNRRGDVNPVVVTAISMGIGAAVLLTTGLAVQGLPPLRPEHWIIIGWLALVNTALAFTLWNRTLRSLTAVESSVINSTMLGQIAVLAWLFLGEGLSWQKGLGLLLTALGTLMVHLRARRGRQAVGTRT
ncbi:MAG: DMT family transporter [Anaerolineae bacterium]|nr:DMT family transporter [Anaerolineae bacterium]